MNRRCPQCGKRMAKRHCPALGTPICALCCGRLREKSLRCPPACPSLLKHQPYQEKKLVHRKSHPLPDIRQDEKLAWLVFQIEAFLYESSSTNPRLTDREIFLALEYAREKIDKGERYLFLPHGDGRIKNALGEAVLEKMRECRYERKIILPQSTASYSREEKLLGLEFLISAISSLVGEALDGRTYVSELAARFSRAKNFAPKKRNLLFS